MAYEAVPTGIHFSSPPIASTLLKRGHWKPHFMCSFSSLQAFSCRRGNYISQEQQQVRSRRQSVSADAPGSGLRSLELHFPYNPEGKHAHCITQARLPGTLNGDKGGTQLCLAATFWPKWNMTYSEADSQWTETSQVLCHIAAHWAVKSSHSCSVNGVSLSNSMLGPQLNDFEYQTLQVKASQLTENKILQNGITDVQMASSGDTRKTVTRSASQTRKLQR